MATPYSAVRDVQPPGARQHSASAHQPTVDQGLLGTDRKIPDIRIIRATTLLGSRAGDTGHRIRSGGVVCTHVLRQSARESPSPVETSRRLPDRYAGFGA